MIPPARSYVSRKNDERRGAKTDTNFRHWIVTFVTEQLASKAPVFRERIEIFNELLGGTFYLLWPMFILSTSLFGSALDRSRPLERWLHWSAAATVAVTAIMLVGNLAGLERWSGPIVTWTYPPLMTAHRTLVGLWLLPLSRQLSSAALPLR